MNDIIHFGDRIKYLKSFIQETKKGLEIGGGYNPLASRDEGYNISFVDHASKAELVAKYKALGVDTSRIQPVDFIWKGEPLSEIVGKTGVFDYIVASHVIEHIPNIVEFFAECDKLLKIGGRVILAIPDKRRCFDHMRPTSTTGQVVEAHLLKKKTHSIAAIFDSIADYSTCDELPSWFSDREPHQANIKKPNSLESALHAAQAYGLGDKYYDAHGWVFTPTSFEDIFENLCRLDLIKLAVEQIHEGDAHEFYAILKKIK